MAIGVSALSLKGVLYGLLQLCKTIFMNELKFEIFLSDTPERALIGPAANSDRQNFHSIAYFTWQSHFVQGPCLKPKGSEKSPLSLGSKLWAW